MDQMTYTSKDLLTFYNRYMERALDANPKAYATPTNPDTMPSVGSTVSNSLIVIDMQKDFTLPDGAFSVVDGLKLIPSLVKFIDDNKDKFHRIVFSRDIHDVNHCSFIGERNGWFPKHCVINASGAEMMPEFLKYEEDLLNPTGKKVQVIFKGMHPDVDSFGAHAYPADDYYTTRQSPECCKSVGELREDSVSCGSLSGGRYHQTRAKGFAPAPFADGNRTVNTYAAIKSELGEAFQVADLVPNGSTEHNVFIVGLAGDFCVRDTAVNIAKAATAAGGTIKGAKINVFVIQEFTRYPALPILYDTPKASKNASQKNANAEKVKNFINKFTNVKTGREKLLSEYVFQNVGNGMHRILSPSELASVGPSLVSDISYVHFLTDPRKFVEQYAETGVKVLMAQPTMMGGRRSRRSRRNTRRSSRRSTRRL